MFTYKLILVCSLVSILRVVECSASPSVLILGAGASGIAAASRLLENNITNIRILEATNRIGGRIYSTEFDDGIVELGAQWCHGEKNNTVYELVKDLNLLLPDDKRSDFYYSAGEKIEKSFGDELMALFEKLYYAVENDNTTLGEYFTKRYTETVTELYKNDKEKLEMALNACDLFLRFILSNEGSFSAYDVSNQQDFVESKGDNKFVWKKTGYKIILDVLMKKYPNPKNALPVIEKIVFNTRVVKITWNSDEDGFTKAVVKCSDGSEYSADHVIVTFSLGVLKHSHKSLFSPPLPNEKVQAIDELGIGAVGKVLLRFPTQWWRTGSSTNFNFIWSKKDREDLLNSSVKGENNLWLLDFMGLYALGDHPRILSAWFAGSSVPEIELFSDDKIVDGVTFVLKKFLGNILNGITPPDVVLRHKWYSDPNFRGTYSYQTLASRSRNISGEETLSQPLKSTKSNLALLFAGEATHPHFYGTVQGAIDSGRREADRLVRLFS